MPSQLSFRTSALLYGTDFAFADLPRILDGALGKDAAEIRVKLLIFPGSLPKLLERAARIATEVDLTRISSGAHAWSARLSMRLGRGKRRVVSGSLALVAHPVHKEVWFLVSDATSEFYTKPLRRLMRAAVGRPVAPIFGTSQISSLLSWVAADPSVRSTRVVQLGYRGNIRSKGATRAVERDRKWTDLSIEEAFSEAIQEGSWVTDARVQYETNLSVPVSLSMSRYGVFAFRHHAGPPAKRVLERAATLAFDWYSFLKNRQRDAATQYHSRPFVVAYDADIIESSEQALLLRKALGGIPNVSCTVLHGNPYLHASMTDFEDGSTYEVLVLHPRELTVIPQGRSTVRALQRLCGQLFSEFREGALREAAHV